jgi:D-glycero-D-manno-heptose 1,7-bisphosphate phosphatase
MKPAVFLDRDGVIIQNRENYVRTWEEVQILPGALDALVELAHSTYRIVIVTNQSAVGRGLISLSLAQEINHRLATTIQQAGGRVDRVYMCPHAPDEVCNCRKPRPGLLTQAAEELDLDLSRSFLVGDALTDLMAASQAGIPHRILVLTGRGKSQALLAEAHQLQPFTIVSHLAEAVERILHS